MHAKTNSVGWERNIVGIFTILYGRETLQRTFCPTTIQALFLLLVPGILMTKCQFKVLENVPPNVLITFDVTNCVRPRCAVCKAGPNHDTVLSTLLVHPRFWSRVDDEDRASAENSSPVRGWWRGRSAGKVRVASYVVSLLATIQLCL